MPQSYQIIVPLEYHRPAPRLVQGMQGTPLAKKYAASKKMIALLLRQAGIKQPIARYSVGMLVFMNVAKSTGELPENGGDIDNRLKTVCDAMKTYKIAEGDGARRWQAIHAVEYDGVFRDTGVYETTGKEFSVIDVAILAQPNRR